MSVLYLSFSYKLKKVKNLETLSLMQEHFCILIPKPVSLFLFEVFSCSKSHYLHKHHHKLLVLHLQTNVFVWMVIT